MAVDERSSPQTGDQLRSKDATNKTTTADSSAACEAAAVSEQPEDCKNAVADDRDVDEAMLLSGPRTGRGRRKQCRPVRLCFRDDEDCDDVITVETKPPTEVNSQLAEVVGLPAQNVCELCGAEEASPEALTAHASTCRGRNEPELDDVTPRRRAFPTPYHELGNELMRGADAALLDYAVDRPLTTTSTSTPPPVDFSLAYVDNRVATAKYHERAEVVGDNDPDVPLDCTLHSEHVSSATLSTSTASSAADVARAVSSAAAATRPPEMTSSATAAALFGSDAEDFCEFCQKRFCNKYYLRKHRHDVHGVTASDTHAPQQHISSSFLPQDSSSLLSLSSDAQTVHDGFIATTSSSSATAQQLPFQTQLMTSLQPFVLPFQTGTSTSNSLLFPSPPSAADLAASPGAAGLLPGLTSLMLLNPFASSLALLNSPSFLHQTSPAAAAYSASSSLNTLAELQKSNAAAAAAVGGGFGGLCDDVAALGALMNPFLPPPSEPTTSMNIDDPLSSSHFCELCRKEFCSAYFLAVHRREKHGIATSTALSDAIRLLAAGNGRSVGALESLGGGTEPGEKVPSSSGAGGRLTKSHSDHASELSRSASSERISSEHVCCLCKKQFPNRYGLVLHLLSAHNIRPEGFGLAGELMQLDGVGGRLQSTAAVSSKTAVGSGAPSASSSNSSKQSDRVSCDVCNKEVCNKYFLKTHKMKVHGMDSAAAAIYNPPPPPLDSTRSEAARSPVAVSSSSRQHQQQQQQHDEMRKALLMADSQFGTFASHLDFALKSAAASTDPTASAAFGVLPPSLQQQQQPGEPMMTASDIFRLFRLAGTKQDDPFLTLGPPPPSLTLQSLLPGSELCDPLADTVKHTKSVELKIPKHVAGLSHHHKDAASVGMQHQAQQPSGRAKHATGHHNGRHGRDHQAAAVGPSERELIQSGIDPEAYCELCQKEFCSKYFLRTHRQKIHGVSASKTEASFDHYRPMSQQTVAANPVLQMFPGLPLPTQTVFGSGAAGLLPSAAVVDPSPDPVVVGPQSRGGGGKEAANATRVTCEVCGKELCNKYFLKTHMAKIHGCTSTQDGGTAEPDVGGEAVSSDASESRGTPAAGDDRVQRGSLYEKCPPTGSLPTATDSVNIPPLPTESVSSGRPHPGNHPHETNDFHRDGSQNPVGRVRTSSDQPRSTHVAFDGKKATEHVLQNGEQSLPETKNIRPTEMDVERTSSKLDTDTASEIVPQYRTEAVQGEKRALAADDDCTVKRPRTDDPSDSSTAIARHVASDVDADRCCDAAANTGVIQFVSRSKDSESRPAENSDEKVTRESWWQESSANATQHSQSVSVEQSESTSKSGGGGDCEAAWFSTVNGHVEPSAREVANSWQPDDQRHQQQQQQQQQAVMQPFIVRQEPPPVPPSSPENERPADECSGDTTQFAACQLVLPVIRPIHDPLTVEFSVTPVSSD